MSGAAPAGLLALSLLALPVAFCACPGAPGGGGGPRRRGADPPAGGADRVGGAGSAAAAALVPGVSPGELVRVPGGAFTRGSAEAPDEAPVRQVALPEFWIERTEVTAAQFRAFVDGGGYDRPEHWSAEGWAWRPGPRGIPDPPGSAPDHPVVLVSLYEAEAYCRHAGRRLPREDEWEKAARGTDGRRYPWGNERDPSRSNHWSRKHGPPTTRAGSWPAASGLSGQSPCGALHMAGNVKEWTSSRYCRASAGPCAWRVVRGGDWTDLLPSQRTTQREPARPDERRPTLGFRCVSDRGPGPAGAAP